MKYFAHINYLLVTFAHFSSKVFIFSLLNYKSSFYIKYSKFTFVLVF